MKQHKNMFYVLTVAALILGMMQQGLDIWALLFHNWILNVVAAIGTVILMYLGISDFVHKIDSGGGSFMLPNALASRSMEFVAASIAFV